MEGTKLYLAILKKTLIMLFVVCILTFLFTKDILYVVSTIYGSLLSIFGFFMIIKMVKGIEVGGNVKGRFTTAYILRYLIYFLAMALGYKMGLNIISMLLGFLCMNIAIKIHSALMGKEEN